MIHKLSEIYALVFCRTETIEFLIFFFFAGKLENTGRQKNMKKFPVMLHQR